MDPKLKIEKRKRRHKRGRARISGVAEKPRLVVFRSSAHIYAQLIDDESGKVLFATNDLELKKGKRAEKAKQSVAEDKKENVKEGKLGGKIAVAFEVGKFLAEKATAKKIKKVVFDRGGCKYHGRVKALADGAREGGLEF